jgi:hypothetical protein
MTMCQVPWSQLGKQPVVLEMDRVYVLVSPLPSIQTPEEQVSCSLAGFLVHGVMYYPDVIRRTVCNAMGMPVSRVSNWGATVGFVPVLAETSNSNTRAERVWECTPTRVFCLRVPPTRAVRLNLWTCAEYTCLRSRRYRVGLGDVQAAMREQDFQKKQERLDQMTLAWIQVRRRVPR